MRQPALAGLQDVTANLSGLGKRQREEPPLGPKKALSHVQVHLSMVAHAAAPDVASKQSVRPQSVITPETTLDQQRAVLNARHNPQHELETVVMVDDSDGGNTRRKNLDRARPLPLYRHPKSTPIRHEKNKVANQSHIDERTVDFVDGAAAECKSEPEHVGCTTDYPIALLRQVGGIPYPGTNAL